MNFYTNRETKAEPYSEVNGLKVYRVGRYSVTAHEDGTLTYRDDYRSSGTNPRQTLPNLAIDDGMVRFPMSDLVDEVMSRASAKEIAIGLMHDEDVRRYVVECLSRRYGSDAFDDADRRRFLAEVKEAVHDQAVDKLINELAGMEWHNGQRYYAHQLTSDANRWLEDHGIDKRMPYESESPEFKVAGKVWNEARNDWRRLVLASFPPPAVPDEPTRGMFEEPKPDWLADAEADAS